MEGRKWASEDGAFGEQLLYTVKHNEMLALISLVSPSGAKALRAREHHQCQQEKSDSPKTPSDSNAEL